MTLKARMATACTRSLALGAAMALVTLSMPAGAAARVASAPQALPATGLAVLASSAPGTGTAGHYTVALVNGAGRVVASATARGRTPIDIAGTRGGGAVSIPLPPVSASRTRTYYLDGDSVVKSLSPTGAVATVTSVPGGPHAHAAFAVSPDDRRIAVGVLTYSDTKVVRNGRTSTLIYVEDLHGGHRVVIFRSATRYEWPIGWHDGALVLALSPEPGTQNDSLNPYFAFGGYHVVSAATGQRLASVCEISPRQQAYPIGPVVPAGTLCLRGTESVPWVDSWSGATRILAGAGFLNSAALSPDGSRYAAVVNGNNANAVVVRGPGGTRATGLRGAVGGWLDATHLLVTPGYIDGLSYHVLDLRTGAVSPVTPRIPPSESLTFYGALPGGL